jgi:hypothetical protein
MNLDKRIEGFRAYLKTRLMDETPIGDLARDAFADGRLRGKKLTPGYLREHLYECYACDGAHKALVAAEEDFDRVKFKF